MNHLKTLFVLLVLSFALAPGASATVLTVDCFFGPLYTIQDAVNASSTGDTIVVHPCSIAPFHYAEQVTISGKSGLHLVGAEAPSAVGAYASGAGTPPPSPPTIIDASGIGSCIVITGGSADVSITGFDLYNCDGQGVVIDNSKMIAVHANRIVHALGGGIRDASNRARITSNSILECYDYGIRLVGTNNAYIADNRIEVTNLWGIYVDGDYNHIVGNEIIDTTLTGLNIDTGQDNRIERNTIIGGATPRFLIGVGAVDTDAVGNSTGGSLSDMGTGTDLGDNS